MDSAPATLPHRLELADTGRAEAADLLRKHFSPDQIKDLKLDVRDYFNHGTDVKRQEMQAKWGEHIGGDFNDSTLYKKLLFAVKDIG
jgi:hypothetical protein